MKQVVALMVLFLMASCQSAPQPVQPMQPVGPTGMLEGIATGKTRIVDLTHALSPQNPYFPEPGFSPFKYEIFKTIEKDGVSAGRFEMTEHTGTHLDAPSHFVAGQTPLDKLPLQQFFAPAVVIDVRAQAAENADYLLSPADVTTWETAHGRIPQNAVVMMYTAWDQRWNDPEKYKNAEKNGTLHFPGFSAEAAKILVEERNVAGLGIDTLSVDCGISMDFPVHHLSHGKGKYHLENVANLGSLPPAGASLIVAPVKIENGTGGPVRIFALIGGSAS